VGEHNDGGTIEQNKYPDRNYFWLFDTCFRKHLRQPSFEALLVSRARLYCRMPGSAGEFGNRALETATPPGCRAGHLSKS